MSGFCQYMFSEKSAATNGEMGTKRFSDLLPQVGSTRDMLIHSNGMEIKLTLMRCPPGDGGEVYQIIGRETLGVDPRPPRRPAPGTIVYLGPQVHGIARAY